MIRSGNVFAIFFAFLRLGLTSFGGPIAHLGYFEADIVRRRKWVTEAEYADIVALCQFLPGPASSQVGAALGLTRGGLPGAFAAWLGFTLPSALALVLFGLGMAQLGAGGGGWLHGLKLVAVAVVTQALLSMGEKLCPDNRRRALAVAAALAVCFVPGWWGQMLVLAGGALIGLALLGHVSAADSSNPARAPAAASRIRRCLRATAGRAASTTPAVARDQPRPDAAAEEALAGSGAINSVVPVPRGHSLVSTPSAPISPATPGKTPRFSRTAGGAALALFALLLVGLPLVSTLDPGIGLFARFYRAGALVFGGGHVVLPLLRAEVVPGMMPDELFLAGYGAAQAVPGPLFTIAAYLGAVAQTPPAGWLGAAIAVAGIFLPGVLLIVGALPFWSHLKRRVAAQAAMRGVNAAVVGILLAALYDPMWKTSVGGPVDMVMVLAGFIALSYARVPPWAVVIAGAAAGALWGQR